MGLCSLRDFFYEDCLLKKFIIVELSKRLQNVQIENTDALRVIRSRDSLMAFHYCDPPYFNSDCGHYDGYSIQDFENLLELLSTIEGKFLLSRQPF
jgi:DNA adenine methylase